MPESPTKILYGVYDADGGVWGELKYILGKASGLAHCSLCDLTHGWSLKGKKDWLNLINQSGLEFKLLHRNEQSNELAKVTSGRTPCIAQIVSHSYSIIVTPVELQACEDDIGKFKIVLASKLGGV